MPLKKPSDLFEEKIEVETPVKVEELQEQTDSISSSLTSSLTEAIDKNLNLLSKEYSEKLDKFNHKIDTFKEEINIKLNGLEKTDQSLKGEIGLVDQRRSRININQIREEVISEIRKLEFKIETIKEAYEETINEGLLNEPPSTDNEDPLTPLDKNYATLDDLNKHYQLFVNRIQKQLSTLGGGGAVNIKDMDDVDQSSARVNDKYLKYDSASSKWVGADASGGGVTNGDKGHITVSNSGATWTIDDNVVTDQQLNDTGVSAGSYTSANITVDAQGRLSAASNGSGITTEFVSAQTLNVVGLSTHRNGINVAGLSYLDGDVSFVGDNQNALWDKSKSDLVLYNDTRLTLGSNEDFQMWHGGTHTFIKNTGGDLRIRGDVIKLAREDSSETYLQATKNEDVKLFFNGVEKFATTNAGIDITGSLDVSDSIFVANNIKHLGDTDTYIEFTADKFRFITGGKSFLDVTQSGASSVVINEQTNYDCDFRVEGISDEHLIFTDAATDRVGIGSAIPRAKLDVNGDVYVGTSQATGVVLTSPNGTKYRLVVADDGTLSTSAV